MLRFPSFAARCVCRFAGWQTKSPQRVSRLASALTACLALMLITAAGFWFAHLRSRTENVGASLVPDTARLDFETVWEQPAFAWTLPITNVSSRTTQIWGIDGSCRCTSVAPRELEIPAGEMRELQLTMDLTLGEWAEGQTARPFSVSLFPKLADQLQNQPVWTLRGQVRRNPISVSQERIDFGNDLVANRPCPPQKLRVELTEECSLQSLRAECRPPEMGVATLRPLEDHPSGYELVVQSVSRSPGPFLFSVRLEVEAGSPSVDRPFRDILATGTLQHDLGAEPAQLVFGARPVSSHATEFLVLSSRLGRPFRVEGIVATDPALSVTVLPKYALEPGGNVYEVRQDFVEVGRQTGSIQFDLRYEDGAREQFPVTVETSYEGLPENSREP